MVEVSAHSLHSQAVALTAGVEQRLGNKLKRAAAAEAEASAARQQSGMETGELMYMRAHSHQQHRESRVLDRMLVGILGPCPRMGL